jgi:hypothetical protein
MKVTAAHLDAMRAVVRPLDTETRRDAYRAGRFMRSERTQDVNRRYRWDLLHASRFDICGELYPYCHDGHIDTALRAIVPPL